MFAARHAEARSHLACRRTGQPCVRQTPGSSRAQRRQTDRPSTPVDVGPQVASVQSASVSYQSQPGSSSLRFALSHARRGRVIALLPDRESSTVEAWLAAHPEITVVARDRGGCYGEATTRALPKAIQVADRWHLMENASAAFLNAVRKSMSAIRIAVGAATVDPERLTCAERLQYDGYLRREATGEAILALSRQGMSIKKIARTTRHSRKLVRDVLRGLTGDVFRARQSSLDAHLPQLDAEWAAGCRNGAELWRRLRASGFTGSLRVVGEWATRRRRSERAPEGAPSKVPSARILSRLMTTDRDSLTKAEAVIVATIEAEVPRLDEARTLLSRFQAMIRARGRPDLDTWIEAAARSLLASFAGGLLKDKAAVAAALTQPWSNGQTEGQITRLKLVKRQMFGRAKLDLIEARLIGTP
ncbi:ISL3 family transposase [Methylobacterium sp. J-001]|uniref:ISL3 family transposase n=1 Tax=Methylobacterium sp. J-001 TaxID=2836609 RepID=UPI0024439CA2|nr:ISL3 family transposase [Methylobacterium sp. J-001]